VDHEVRWAILALADILIRPREETPPALRIHLPPPTPVTPTAPVPSQGKNAPKLRLNVAAKVATPQASSTTPIVKSATKLKLSNSTALLDGTPPGSPRFPLVAVQEHHFTDKSVLGSSTSNAINRKTKAKTNKPSIQPSKGSSNGMLLGDLAACRLLLKKLKANKHGVIFLQPVDPVRDKAPRLVNG
jgi:transcription initiation factor TFIID subunit 2